MNGKQAKRLRKAAIHAAASLVEQGRTIHEDQHIVKPEPQQDHTPGKRSPQPVKPSNTQINRIDTLRGIYRHLKKIT